MIVSIAITELHYDFARARRTTKPRATNEPLRKLVILSEAKDLEMRSCRIWRSFVVFATQDDG